MFGGAGSVLVAGTAPANVLDFRSAADDNPESIIVSKAVVQVHGSDALLIHERLRDEPGVDSFRLLWAQDGNLIQAGGYTLRVAGQLATPGPDALIALANAVRSYAPAVVDSSDFDTASSDPPSVGGQFSVVTTGADARAQYGSPLALPPSFSSITVLHAGSIRSYTVDLDPQGNRRLFLAAAPPPDRGSSPEAAGVGTARAAQAVSVRGTPAVYERVVTTAASTSLLHFHVGTTQLLLEDANGASAQDLVAIAETVATQDGAPPSASATSAPQ